MKLGNLYEFEADEPSGIQVGSVFEMAVDAVVMGYLSVSSVWELEFEGVGELDGIYRVMELRPDENVVVWRWER